MLNPFSASVPPPPPPPPPFAGIVNTKKKRRPAGTPDPDAEVVSLSPRTLLESDRYACEICGKGFQREQNLQMHLRRHKVPWKLLKRPETAATEGARKRVFVCPEQSCLHHDPGHALGDLVGIKKHFRRKHSSHRQWICAKCSKAYAVQSDYKAHLKTCGTRGHCCDCGRVFSRVESFIEHQDACTVGRTKGGHQIRQPPPSISSYSHAWSEHPTPTTNPAATIFVNRLDPPPSIELQLLPPPATTCATLSAASLPTADELTFTKLQLSTGPFADDLQSSAARLKGETMEQLRLAMAERELAEGMRLEARRQHELAEKERENAKRIRRNAQLELNRARLIRECAVKRADSAWLTITCCACRRQFQVNPSAVAPEVNSLGMSYMSEVTEIEEDNIHRRCRHRSLSHHLRIN